MYLQISPDFKLKFYKSLTKFIKVFCLVFFWTNTPESGMISTVKNE